MQNVINLTRDLKKFFPKTEKPLIVTNIGGFSMDEPFSKDKIEYSYELFSHSLKSLDLNGVELIPQTMAPFPWHFGGQRYQNLFVHADEIPVLVQEIKSKDVLSDVSHSALTCNNFEIDFYKFCYQVAPLTAHLHLGDASGVNGEGLQIGSGEINFKSL